MGYRILVALLDGEKECINEILSLGFNAYFDFNSINGLTGAESLAILREAVQRLGTEGIPNYWVEIPGNVGIACNRLIKGAEQHPEARWNIEQ